MKLAEALAQRADRQKRLEQLKQRLLRNARVQEGEAPAESAQALLAEHEAVAAELLQLITRINLTNAAAALGGRPLTEALARRDVLRLREAFCRAAAEAATVTQSAVTRSEIRFKPTLSVAAVQKQADDLSKELRELDTRIQEANWLIELGG